DLVLMVREAEVGSPRVDVDPVAQVLHGHRRAFDMPAGEAVAPRARPLHEPAWSGGLPQREVRGLVLPWVGLEVAVPFPVLAEGVAVGFAVAVEARDVVADGSVVDAV